MQIKLANQYINWSNGTRSARVPWPAIVRPLSVHSFRNATQWSLTMQTKLSEASKP